MFAEPHNLFSTNSVFFLNKTHKTKFKRYEPGLFIMLKLRKRVYAALKMIFSSRIMLCMNLCIYLYMRSRCDGSLDRSLMMDPLIYFLFQPVIHDWGNKGRGMGWCV